MLLWLGIAILLLYSLAGLDMLIGNRSIRALRESSPQLPAEPPRVSVAVAARDEARNIREALQSLLQLDYPNLELIVVDDRSSDGTAEILDKMATASPHLRVLHVSELPAGWLGKNHALWLGSRRATGELLLFTDADIVMQPDALSRAVNHLRACKLDHLAATPSMRMPNLFLAMFGASFILFFSLFARPWKAKSPTSSCHIGIGAFNLVRTAVYRSVGGHEAIRLRPDDDLKLGKIIKKRGFRQDVVYAPEFLAVEWYASVGEVILGLEKNAFAGTDYRVWLVLSGAVFHLLAGVWPYLAVIVTHGTTRLVYCTIVTLITLLFADSAGFHGARRWHAIAYPLTTLLFVYILLRTTVLNLVRRGIRWRGTFYPLKELKGNRV
ncbi:glycosyltransferase family 2 protein [Geobacter sp. SVR]|uniref:glycosyltransferase n=1 Tax=Geobacter sp. SVR TaxID=2495594 RepID=UPI00143F006A|nr:glycosyltransferase [Geobacter sp. SVR]BCS55720.1 glycosyl hydrolase [Geobacter sp. SVR]GCF83724.1 glycosyl hydrolase [Geobacter sp. SVR]